MHVYGRHWVVNVDTKSPDPKWFDHCPQLMPLLCTTPTGSFPPKVNKQLGKYGDYLREFYTFVHFKRCDGKFRGLKLVLDQTLFLCTRR